MDVELFKYIDTCKKQQQQIRLTPIKQPTVTLSKTLTPKILTQLNRRATIKSCGVDPLTGCIYGSLQPCIIEKNYRELWEIYQSRTRHPKYVIDHINGCDYDNSIWNLREITTHDNRRNRFPFYLPVESHYWENILPPIPYEYLNKQVFPTTLPFASITKIFEHYASSIEELILLGLQYTEIKALCRTNSEQLDINLTTHTTTSIKQHFLEDADHYNAIRLKQVRNNLHKDLLTY